VKDNDKNQVITRLQKTENSDTSVDIYVNGEFLACLSLDMMVKLKLYKGKTLTRSELENISNWNFSPKLLEKIRKWLTLRPRSIKELYEYIVYRLNLTQAEFEKILKVFKGMGLIDDNYFAHWFVKSRVEHKFYGKKKVFFELTTKGIDRVIIEESLAKFYPNILEVNKILKFMKKLSGDYNKNKLIRKLLGLGFDYRNIKKAIQIYEKRDG
jgi:regulatory protein